MDDLGNGGGKENLKQAPFPVNAGRFRFELFAIKYG